MHANNETSITAPAVDADESALRRRATQRSWLCPGAGLALMGHHGLAVIVLLAACLSIGPFIWLVVRPSLMALQFTALALVVYVVLQIGEYVGVRSLKPKMPSRGILVRRFWPITITAWVVAVALAMVIVVRYGSLQMAGSGMSPTLLSGERLLYQRTVDRGKLRAGSVVVYRVPRGSAWGKPGWLVISRILAVPGDTLSQQDGHYTVNRHPAQAVSPTGQYEPVIEVPQHPSTVAVPPDSYFVVQDSPQGGFDSRVLSWVHVRDVVSTEIYYLSRRGILKRVE